jgi:hypothetical protein
VEILGTEIFPDGYSNIVEWSWAEGEGGLLNPNIINPNAVLPGDYFLYVTFFENGCATMALEAVTVEQDEDAFIDISSLTMPNVLTPGVSTGMNDFLTPYLTDLPEITVLSVLDEYNLRIFNRWGGLVFKNNGLPLPWDGKANGSFVNAGTYIIVLDYKSICGKVQTGSHTGTLEIIR